MRWRSEAFFFFLIFSCILLLMLLAGGSIKVRYVLLMVIRNILACGLNLLLRRAIRSLRMSIMLSGSDCE